MTENKIMETFFEFQGRQIAVGRTYTFKWRQHLYTSPTDYKYWQGTIGTYDTLLFKATGVVDKYVPELEAFRIKLTDVLQIRGEGDPRYVDGAFASQFTHVILSDMVFETEEDFHKVGLGDDSTLFTEFNYCDCMKSLFDEGTEALYGKKYTLGCAILSLPNPNGCCPNVYTKSLLVDMETQYHRLFVIGYKTADAPGYMFTPPSEMFKD
jgi:hypothetical protein